MPLIPLFLETEEPLPDPPPMPTTAAPTHVDRYELVVETMAGVRLAPLPSGVAEELTDPLNAPSVLTAKVSCYDPNISALLNDDGEPWTLKRYLALIYNGYPIHRGPIVQASIEAGVISLTAPDPSWWFQHRIIGRAQRDNMLGDGIFDDSGTGWDAANCAPTWVTDDVTLEGSHSARIYAPVDYGPGAYIAKVATYTPTGFSQGLTYVALGWLKVPDPVTWKGRVMEVLRYNSEADRLADKAADRQTFSSDDIPDPDENGWRPIPVPFHVPPGSSGAQVEVRFMAPAGPVGSGFVEWGSGWELVRDDTFASEENGTNLATLAKWLVQWIQDPDKGGTPLHLTTDCPEAATVDTLSIPEHELRTADDVLRTNLVDVAGGVDWRIVYGRRSTTFQTGFPRFDRVRNDMPLREGRYWLNVPWDVDASDLDTDVIAKGADDGFWAQDGSFVDRSALDDDLNTVGVWSAPSGTPYSGLRKMAQRRSEVRSVVARKPKGTLPAGFWLWTATGEVYPSQHGYGKVKLAGSHRAQTRTLRPANGTMEVELAPVLTGKELADDLVALHDRVAQLAARPQPTLRGWVVALATFSQSGPVQATADGGSHMHPVPARAIRIDSSLSSVASSDINGTISLDGGANTITFTHPAGVKTFQTWLDPVQLASPGVIDSPVVSGGADGMDLVVHVVLRELPR